MSLNPLEGHSLLGKDGLDQTGLLSKTSDGEVEWLMPYFQIPAQPVGHRHVFEI